MARERRSAAPPSAPADASTFGTAALPDVKSLSETMLTCAKGSLAAGAWNDAIALVGEVMPALQRLWCHSGGDRKRRELMLVIAAVHAVLGEAMSRTGDHARAARHIKRACKNFDRAGGWKTLVRRPGLITFWMIALEHAGRSGEVSERLLAASGQETLLASDYASWAARRIEAGDMGAAAHLLVKTVDANGLDNAAWQTLASLLNTAAAHRAVRDAYEEHGRKPLGDEAVNRWLELIDGAARNAPTADLEALRGLVLMDGGRAADAVRPLRAALSAVPSDEMLRLELALALCDTGQVREALAVQDTPHDDSPAAFRAYYVRGHALNQLGEHKSAVANLDASLSHRPDYAPALLERALARFRLGQIQNAWRDIDQAVASGGEPIAAARLKADLLLAGGDHARAAQVASDALEHGAMGADAADLRLTRAKAYIEDGRLAEAEADLRAALDAAPASTEVFTLLLETLRSREHWNDIVALTGGRLAQRPHAPDLLWWQAVSLHALHRHEDALELLADVPRDPALERLKSVLLCDVGDFENALTLLVPATEPIEQASPDLLSLRGWAHQHLEGAEHAATAERVYREAHRQQPDDLWYREGIAHALSHMPGRQEEAALRYGEIVDSVEALRHSRRLDAFMACLAGWCCFCTNRDGEAAAYYATALTTMPVGPAAELDYALILLASGCEADARVQYESTIRSIASINPLRRGGLLSVALFDLRDAVRVRSRLAASTERVNAERMLAGALRKAVDAYRPAFAPLAARMRSFLASLESAGGGAPVTPPPAATPARDRISGQESPKVRFAIPGGHIACGLLSPSQMLDDDPETQSFSLDCGSPEHHALYVTQTFLDASGLTRDDTAGERVDWKEVRGPVQAYAACVCRGVGERVLNEWGARLLQTAKARLPGYAAAGSPLEALTHAELAIRAARDETMLYEAALIRAAAGAERPGDLVELRSDLHASARFDDEELRRIAARFRVEPPVLKQEPKKPAPGQPAEMPAAAAAAPTHSPLVEDILARAYAIAKIEDASEQERSAKRAAAAVEALIPLPATLAERTRLQLERQLASHDRFYLDTDASILLMARAPAFYSSAVLLNLTWPAVNSFAFLTARRRYQKSGALRVGGK